MCGGNQSQTFLASPTLLETVLKGKKRFSVQKRESSDQNCAKLKKHKKVTKKCDDDEEEEGFFFIYSQSGGQARQLLVHS